MSIKNFKDVEKGVDKHFFAVYNNAIEMKQQFQSTLKTMKLPPATGAMKGGEPMSEKEKQILNTFGKLVPNLSEMEKEKVLAFGEGMAFMVDRRNQEQAVKDGDRDSK